ncbi:MAG: hypothetical protein ACFFDN_17335 [Candidatus Hodarchaeota archaeon]
MGNAVLKALRHLEGSYAVAVVSMADLSRIYCARNKSPFVIGVSEKGTFCASDVPAVLPYTNKVVYLRNGEFAVLDSEDLMISQINSRSNTPQ